MDKVEFHTIQKLYQFNLLIADYLTLSFLRKVVTPAKAGAGIHI